MPELPPKPTNERERLAALHQCGVLDTAPEPAFDDIARIATQVCGVPIGLVTLVDDKRQWFKARIGLEIGETPRDVAFCAHAIVDPKAPLVVHDALLDARFAANPLVTADPRIRFYAGVPLVLDDGAAVGTLCVIDQVPRELSAAQLEALTLLARQVTRELRLRRQLAALQPDGPAAPPAGALADSLRATPLPVDTIAGRYRLGDILGVGGMGLVVGATDLKRGEEVAIKFLLPEIRCKPDILDRFVREARALIAVRCEHVARILDVGSLGNGAPFIVMERLFGLDLDDILVARGRLPALEAAEYVLQACAGVARIHDAGIVHRDLKPPNLFLADRPGAAPLIKVLDFGVAIRPGAGDEDVLAGSPQYMAPEQMLADGRIDERADVWSLGVVLYELIAGVRPFDGDTAALVCRKVLIDDPVPLVERCPDVPPAIAAIVDACLHKDRRRRPSEVEELAHALAAALAALRPA